MKKLLFIAYISIMVFGCNVNPSKETRIQALESEMVITRDKIKKFEKSIQSLEKTNKKLEARILELENK